MDGLEDLAEEVEAWHEGDMDPTETKRFNPCFYLAQFLMRNNPQFLDNSKKYNDNHILEREKKRRVIVDLKPELLSKIEARLEGKVYSVQNMTNVFIEMDDFLQANGKLKKAYVSFKFDLQPTLPEAAKAKEVSQTYTSEHLFKDLVTFYLNQQAMTPEELSDSLKKLV